MVEHTIEHSVVVAAGRDAVWDVIENIGAVDQWSPPVPLSEPIGSGQGPNAQRRCTFDPPKGKKWVREEVVEYDREAGVHITEIVEGTAKPPFERVRGALVLDSVDQYRTAVLVRFEIVSKGPMQWALAVLGRPMLARTGHKVLAGLQNHFDKQVALPE